MSEDLTRDEIEALIERLSGIAVAVNCPTSMVGISYDPAQLVADAVRAARALRQLLDELAEARSAGSAPVNSSAA